MIEVTVAYPAGQGRTFNMDYYLKTHIPLFQKRMGAAMKTIRVSRGIGGSTPRSPAAFVAMVHATFDSAEMFAAVLSHGRSKGMVPSSTFWALTSGTWKTARSRSSIATSTSTLCSNKWAYSLTSRPRSKRSRDRRRGPLHKRFLYAPRYFISIPARSTIDRSLAS